MLEKDCLDPRPMMMATDVDELLLKVPDMFRREMAKRNSTSRDGWLVGNAKPKVGEC